MFFKHKFEDFKHMEKMFYLSAGDINTKAALLPSMFAAARERLCAAEKSIILEKATHIFFPQEWSIIIIPTETILGLRNGLMLQVRFVINFYLLTALKTEYILRISRQRICSMSFLIFALARQILTE